MLAIYTLIHLAISLIGIGTGFVVLAGLLKGQRLDVWTKVFLWTTVLTSVTGFGFPVNHVTPGHVFGVVSLVLLAIAIVARYRRKLAGGWRPTYVITAMMAQYLNVFVLVVQSFQKVPTLHALAPTQSEAPFAVTQIVVLVSFVALIARAVLRSRELA
ncbi:MAG TPA: hypothetical protein VGM76_01840 [Lacipirellulaceae bacterium]|jgi:hypothetical protein